MEVKPGYKQTEMGVIPEDWAIKTLGNIASIATGNTPPTRDPANYGDEFLFVSPMDMGSHKHIFRTERRLSQKGFEISRPFPTGSVLFVCIGSTIGKCGIATETLTSNQQINAILPSEGTSSDYLYYAVSAVAPKIQSLAGEQAVPIVNKTAFSETVIPLPPTKIEQEAIADALSDADGLIEELEKLTAKKRRIKQGAMQELLTGKKRLPGFQTNAGYKQTEVGVIPEDWKYTTVSQLVRDGILEKPLDGNHGNIHPKSEDFVSFGIPFVMANNVQDGRVDLSNCKFIREHQANSLQKGFSLQGDVLLTHKATIGNTAVVEENPFKYIMLTPQVTYYRVADHTRLSNFYLRQFFDSSIFQSVLLSMSGGGTRAYIGITAQLQLPIVLPSTKAEQDAIAEALSDMDLEIASVEVKLTKTYKIKQGMMQELLTGKIRLI